MRKLFYLFLVLWVAISGMHISATAQTGDLSTDIPFDPQTRVGTLENGMKYYIRKNAKPENFAELRLALNAGSILETDQQQGLAHFVEHMCFNGTENFPKSALVDYLEAIGTKFGAHLNAYTSFDETVYMLRVPTDDQEKFEKGMMILEEWAHNVSFEGEEIDKERGVVVEEWRTRLGANNRMLQKTFPKTFYGSKYAERLPIGKKEVLENFPHETLVQFYNDWYRPDLMAIVAVGDFEVDQVEKMIQERFGKIAPATNPKPRPVFEIPDHEETFVSIVTDEEATYNRVSLQYKHDARKYKTLKDYRVSIIENLTASLINGRLGELRQSENPPFNFAYSGYSGMARSKDDYSAMAIVSEDGFMKGLEALLTEQERAIKYGFTETELERAKKSMLAGLEKQFNERDKTPSSRLVMSYVYNYLSGSPVEGIENTVKLYEQFLPGITLEEVNQEFRGYIQDKNRVIILSGIEKEGVEIPTEAEVRKMLAEVSSKEITAYEDQVSDQPFFTAKPTPGTVTQT
ncbi:MAG: insulinase family protein, partial [Bacteroidetes bacterium]|nr:insulinase family protein [Bacteroidota bacterium]